MKVSIVIPCYNQAQFLRGAIETALGQSYPHKEVIVVNDGSTDNTSEVAGKYPVKLVIQSNKGLSMARNAGIMNATGELFLPLDADDKIDRDYLLKTVGKMDDSKVGVVYTALETFGEVAEQWMHPIHSIKLENLKQNNQLYVCSLIRMEALKQCGGYNTRMIHGYEDWDLWIDLCKRGWKFEFVAETLFKYRIRKDGMYNTVKDKWHEWNLNQLKQNHPEVYA